MASLAAILVKEVQATKFRDRYRRISAGAKGGRVILIVNRRQKPKYLVDKEFLDSLIRERNRAMATLEVLADPKLTERLLRLADTIDEDVRAGRLYSMKEVFEQA